MKLRRRIAWALGYDLLRIRKSSSSEALTRQLMMKAQPSLVFDVGGNEGQFAHEALTSPGHHKVVSFEPLSQAHAILEAKAKSVDRWQVAPRCAIGDEKSISKINISSFSGSSSLRGMNETHLKAAPTTAYCGEESVDVLRLDDIGKGYIEPRDRIYLKVDTQGYEKNVLDGATDIMPQVVAMQVEVAFAELYNGETLAFDLIPEVLAQGLSLFGFCNGLREKSTGRLLQADAFFIRA